MSKSPKSNHARWSGLAIAAITVLSLWWFAYDLDTTALKRAFAAADFKLIGVAVLTTLQTYLIRAWRWQTMLRPIGKVGFWRAFRATVIGFFPFPARLGEVLRPYQLARQEHLSFSAVFATIILERELDLTAVLLLFAAAMPFMQFEVDSATRIAGVAAAVAAVIGLAALFIFAGHPERVGQWTDRLTRWLPARIAEAIGGFARKFAEGLAVMRRPQALVISLAWSLALWVSICLGIWLVSRAFGLTVPFEGTFLVVMYLVLGVAVPTPGGAGGFHVAYKYALMHYFGGTADVTAAGAIMLHFVSFVPVALLGLLFMWQDGVTLGGLKEMRPDPEAGSGGGDKDVGA
jgi:glycosyltransferase 2 family protein